MTAADIVGWMAALVAISISIPQIILLVRTRSTAGLSLLAWQAILAITLAWTVHGFLLDALNMIVPNAISVVLAAVVLVLTLRERGLRPVRVFLPGVVTAAVMVGVDLLFGTTGYGLVAMVVAVVANAGQGVDLVRSRSIAGVAPGFLFAQLTNQILWLAWGVLVQDQGTVMASVATGLIALFNAVWWLLRSFGLRPLFVRPEPAGLPGSGTAQVSCEA
ncbi:MAG: PQ-loop domain-containing transporter [Propionicimonas sp.]|uniref:SemiSWEET family sugar transporter n=1 Tax=Propionicimonas sp. TaxID=1955623 RepID=UPI002B21F7A2|nr:PQ-loop domain-containing transporter [Propionicimonas sp.]MEA4945222.1 PQ-loop domain-containing transporter [Propionicimonas sp.]MEA5053721.1 PQ-loop domain-containing transporter [Propionicimonas sp.]MEA5117213.1 PQ-loop domain-containing transporter [Propionicimonas sp.]